MSSSSLIAGYRLGRQLGEGGFATVFEAVDPAGSVVAVKLGRRGSEARMDREADALARVGAPATPALIARGTTDDGAPYIVMERIGDHSLEDWLRGPRSIDERVEVVRSLCGALDRVHAAGVAHCDLKPPHVFLRADGSATLIDFGLARGRGDARLTRTGQRIGTPRYMSPEQCAGSAAVDARADIYALGIIVFEALTGRVPFSGDDARVLHAQVAERPPRPSQLADLPEALDAPVLRCLAKAPELRFERAGDLMCALDSARSTRVIRDAEADPPAVVPAAEYRRVALLAVGVRASALEVDRALRGDGAIERISPEGCVVAFPEVRSPGAGVRRALHVANELPAVDGAVLIHVAELRVATGRRTRTSGPAIDNVGGWSAGAPAVGVAMTGDAARSLGEGVTVVVADGWHAERMRSVHDDTGDDNELHGRRALLATLIERSRRPPSLTTVVGEPGMGASRLLAELASRCDRRVLWTRPSSLIDSLLRSALGLGDVSTLDELRMAWSRALDAPAEGSSFWACALALGAVDDGHPEVATVVAAPGALRQAGRAAADALARVAGQAPLVIVADDLQLGDGAGLDALELCVLRGADIAVIAAASPAFLGARPKWGTRTAEAKLIELSPLEDSAARAMLVELLAPAEFVPAAVLDGVLAVAGGAPLHLVELARALRAAGGFRSGRGADGVFVAADQLLHVSATPLAWRLAATELERLPAPLRELAYLCAVCGDDVTVGELERARSALWRWVGAPRHAIDAGVAVQRLVGRRLLVARARGRFAFRTPLLARGILTHVPQAQRAQLHRAALDTVSPDDEDALARRARHAAGCGAHDLAWTAYLELAESARRRHQYVEAERLYTVALLQLPDRDDRRAQAHAGRGQVRYRIHRFDDALADLRCARSIAHARGDELLAVSLLLDEATVLDWCNDYTGAAACAGRAAERAASPDAALTARLELARGRSLHRSENRDEAIEVLGRAVSAAQTAGDYETGVIARLLRATSLSYCGRRAEATAEFDRVVAQCEAAGDDLHLGAAFANRQFLALQAGRVDDALRDLRRCFDIAQVLGNATLERVASHNLAEILYWQGYLTDALPLALRSLELVKRFLQETPIPDDALLIARIAAARGDVSDARAQLEWIDAHCPPHARAASATTLIHMVELQIEGAAETEWTDLVAAAEQDPMREIALEVVHAAARAAAGAGREANAAAWRSHGAQLPDPSGVWRSRFD